MANLHPLIRQELDSFSLQFPSKSHINLDQYAELYGISRRNASQHLRRRGIPYTKEGRDVYISLIDLATYKAQRKQGVNNPIITKPSPGQLAQEMKNRRGFSQMAQKKQLKGL